MQKFTKFQLISTLPQVSLSEVLIGQKCVILTKSVKLTKNLRLAKFNPHPKIDRNRDNFDPWAMANFYTPVPSHGSNLL